MTDAEDLRYLLTIKAQNDIINSILSVYAAIAVCGGFMAKIYTSVDALIGNTPMLKLGNLEREMGLCASLFAKLEMFNPAGSAKDRVAKKMIDDAEKSGKIDKDTVIIEPTSGNTGIGLAAVSAARGYRTVIVMPDTMSAERRKLITAYGAELVLSDGALGISGAIAKAEEIAAASEKSFIAGQFINPSNPEAHYLTTGPEIYSDLDGRVDMFVAGIGTGGTVTGVGRYLKSVCDSVKVIGVEPSDSAVLSGGKAGAHKLQGIGAGFIPEVLDLSVCDEIVSVTAEEAYEYARKMGALEGVLVGISSGAALCAAVRAAKREENKGKNIVVLLVDSGDRYLSTDLY